MPKKSKKQLDREIEQALTGTGPAEESTALSPAEFSALRSAINSQMKAAGYQVGGAVRLIEGSQHTMKLVFPRGKHGVVISIKKIELDAVD